MRESRGVRADSRRFYQAKLRRFSRVLSQRRRIIEEDKTTRDFPEKAMPFLFLFVDREWLTLTPEEPSSPQGEVEGGKKRALPRLGRGLGARG